MQPIISKYCFEHDAHNQPLATHLPAAGPEAISPVQHPVLPNLFSVFR